MVTSLLAINWTGRPYSDHIVLSLLHIQLSLTLCKNGWKIYHSVKFTLPYQPVKTKTLGRADLWDDKLPVAFAFLRRFRTNSMAAFSRSVCSRCFLSLSVSGLHCNFGILSLPLYSCLYKSIVAVASPLCLVDGPAPAFGSIEKYVSHRRIGGHCNYYKWPARELTRSILSKIWSKWQ